MLHINGSLHHSPRDHLVIGDGAIGCLPSSHHLCRWVQFSTRYCRRLRGHAVGDSNNHVIRKITSAAAVTTFAGTAGFSGFTDATGSAARFNEPRGIAVDSGGTLWVADQANHVIRKITSAAVVTTFAGTAGYSGSTDGTGSAARFFLPFGIAVDSGHAVGSGSRQSPHPKNHLGGCGDDLRGRRFRNVWDDCRRNGISGAALGTSRYCRRLRRHAVGGGIQQQRHPQDHPRGCGYDLRGGGAMLSMRDWVHRRNRISGAVQWPSGCRRRLRRDAVGAG